MTCTFCGSPAAHPSTGCVYGPRTLACASCVRDFWAWVVRHTNGKNRRRDKRIPVAASFYEAATKFSPRAGGG